MANSMTSKLNFGGHEGELSRRAVLRTGSIAAMLAAGGTGLLAACGDPDEQASGGKPKRGGTLKIAMSDASTTDTLDPARIANQFLAILGSLVYDPFLRQDKDFQPMPSIATKWEVSEDARKWAFDLRDDVTFHDGSKLTARDIAYTIGRHLDPEVRSALFAHISGSLKPSGIRVVNDHRIELDLEQPNALMATFLASRHMYVVKDGTTSFDDVVGTGPFTLDDFQPGQSFYVKRNDSYWAEEGPYLDGVRGVVIPDQASKLRAVSSGDAHISDSIDYSLVAVAKGDQKLKMVSQPGSFFNTIVCDESQKPFDDVRVRQALKLAMDREQVVQTVYGEYGVVSGDTPILPTHPAYPQKTFAERDVARAKALLAEAGYPDGIDLTLDTSPLRAGMTDLAVAFANSVKEAGIRVKINQQPAANFFTSVWLKRPFYVSYWATYDPTQIALQTLVTGAGQNESRFSNSAFDGLVKQSVTTVPADERAALMSQALSISATESGWIIPAIIDLLTVMKTSVNGVTINSMEILDLRKAWLASS